MKSYKKIVTGCFVLCSLRLKGGDVTVQPSLFSLVMTMSVIQSLFGHFWNCWRGASDVKLSDWFWRARMPLRRGRGQSAGRELAVAARGC